MGNTENEFIEKLYIKMYPILFSVARSQIWNSLRAEELAQETFQIALEKIESIMRSPNPEGWLQKTLKNLILHEIRLRQQFVEIFVELETLPESALSTKHDDLMFEIKSVLAQDEWDILRKIYIEGSSLAELAEEMGLKYDTCRKRLYKILSKAKEHLNIEDFEENE